MDIFGSSLKGILLNLCSNFLNDKLFFQYLMKIFCIKNTNDQFFMDYDERIISFIKP